MPQAKAKPATHWFASVGDLMTRAQTAVTSASHVLNETSSPLLWNLVVGLN